MPLLFSAYFGQNRLKTETAAFLLPQGEGEYLSSGHTASKEGSHGRNFRAIAVLMTGVSSPLLPLTLALSQGEREYRFFRFWPLFLKTASKRSFRNSPLRGRGAGGEVLTLPGHTHARPTGGSGQCAAGPASRP